ncbi:putative serine/threonine-protein kinase sky1 [Calycina marina]|uniref:Serine/threonine-protein kinase sky1 n=1 Tax=Calycina marina TaxID=1763456 RepID=A0A9P8CKV1_9HELO|nr:putative serine/threonine-protein kinase sky1 [Calycina marina]
MVSYLQEREVDIEKLYPNTLRELINEKYKVVAKSGFRSASTIWCCHNLAIFYRMAEESPYKNTNGFNLYRSANFGLSTNFGRPIICDFSLAQNGQVEHCQNIQPSLEVILETPWGYAVDIWNVGVMVLDILPMANSKTLMTASKSGTCLRTDTRFNPPLNFLQRSEHSPVNFKCVNRILPAANKKSFLNFVRKMARWTPEWRVSASELLEDSWLLEEGTVLLRNPSH